MSAKKLHPQADYLLDLLVAAGHITREKAFQARDIALEFGPAAATGVAVSWQVRRTDGSPLACWEACTKDMYDLTLSTRRYYGFENGPPCEVRALGVIGAPGAPQEAAAGPTVGQEAMLKALKFHPSASHISPDFRDLFNATLQQHFYNYVRYGAALAGGDRGEGS